jgi:hypothetical protein
VSYNNKTTFGRCIFLSGAVYNRPVRLEFYIKLNCGEIISKLTSIKLLITNTCELIFILSLHESMQAISICIICICSSLYQRKWTRMLLGMGGYYHVLLVLYNEIKVNS